MKSKICMEKREDKVNYTVRVLLWSTCRVELWLNKKLLISCLSAIHFFMKQILCYVKKIYQTSFKTLSFQVSDRLHVNQVLILVNSVAKHFAGIWEKFLIYQYAKHNLTNQDCHQSTNVKIQCILKQKLKAVLTWFCKICL